MDATTGKVTPIYNRRKICQAVCGRHPPILLLYSILNTVFSLINSRRANKLLQPRALADRVHHRILTHLLYRATTTAQIPNVHMVGSFPHSQREPALTKMPRLTTNTLLNIRCTQRKRKHRLSNRENTGTLTLRLVPLDKTSRSHPPAKSHPMMDMGFLPILRNSPNPHLRYTTDLCIKPRQDIST